MESYIRNGEVLCLPTYNKTVHNNKPARWDPSSAWIKKQNQILKWHILVQNLDDQCDVQNIKLQT
jgi:hypothetical protein